MLCRFPFRFFQVIQIILEFKTIVDISDGPEDDAIIDYETLFCMNRIGYIKIKKRRGPNDCWAAETTSLLNV